MERHGHVVPLASGAIARCGGPGLGCPVCLEEKRQMDSVQKNRTGEVIEHLRKEFGPKSGSLYRHYKGGLYRVLLIANAASTYPEKFPVSVVYAREVDGEPDGTIWVRPLEQWNRSMTFVSSVDDEVAKP